MAKTSIVDREAVDDVDVHGGALAGERVAGLRGEVTPRANREDRRLRAVALAEDRRGRPGVAGVP